MSSPETRLLRALLIADQRSEADRLLALLQEGRTAPVALQWADSIAEGLARPQAGSVDVVLLDLSSSDKLGLDSIAEARRAAPDLPIVVLSGDDDSASAANALRSGAQDCLVKGRVDGYVLVRALQFAAERKRLEDERSALAARAQAAQREVERQKDEFFANISHDLRSPLFAIKFSIGALLANQPADLPEPLQRLVTNIDSASDQMVRLVDDLLELTRLQSGRVQLRLAECDLSALITRVVQTIDPLAASRGQRLIWHAPAEPVLVEADAARLERALRKLLDNARKFGPSGGTVEVTLRRLAAGALISVADDGPGILPGEHERIFQRYYRSATAGSGRQQGSGLGLAIARGLIELHGGRLWVESQPGAGATFLMSLPERSPGWREPEAEFDEDSGR